MALKKTSNITTLKGDSLDKIDNYVKLDKKALAEEEIILKPTDYAEGTSSDYGNFCILIDDNNSSYVYVPSCDVDFYRNLSEQEKNELCTDTKVVFEAKENKKGQTYFVTVCY